MEKFNFPNWTIREDAAGMWCAESDTGIRVWADAREKLVAWLEGQRVAAQSEQVTA